MNLESMIAEVIPTMLWAWIFVGLFILFVQLLIKVYRWSVSYTHLTLPTKA